MAHGPRKKPLDFGGNLDYVMLWLELGLRLGGISCLGRGRRSTECHYSHWYLYQRTEKKSFSRCRSIDLKVAEPLFVCACLYANSVIVVNCLQSFVLIRVSQKFGSERVLHELTKTRPANSNVD